MNINIIFISVIEVAIGEYGIDVLDKLAESTTNKQYTNGRHHHNNIIISDDQQLHSKSGKLQNYH